MPTACDHTSPSMNFFTSLKAVGPSQLPTILVSLFGVYTYLKKVEHSQFRTIRPSSIFSFKDDKASISPRVELLESAFFLSVFFPFGAFGFGVSQKKFGGARDGLRPKERVLRMQNLMFFSHTTQTQTQTLRSPQLPRWQGDASPDGGGGPPRSYSAALR